jgi:hypothetical protein
MCGFRGKVRCSERLPLSARGGRPQPRGCQRQAIEREGEQIKKGKTEFHGIVFQQAAEHRAEEIVSQHNVNAADFCKEACRETRGIIQEMTDKFGLS